MSKIDELRAKSKPALPVEGTEKSTTNKNVVLSKVDDILQDIENELNLLNGAKEIIEKKAKNVLKHKKNIIIKLYELKKHEKELVKSKEITFEEYLNEIGVSKNYYYESARAYKLCLDYNKPEVFINKDVKVLLEISKLEDKTEQKETFKNIDSITRKDFQAPLEPNLKSIEKQIKNLIDYYGKEEALKKLNDIINAIV